MTIDINKSKVFLFEGRIGAGKTTYIQTILKELGYVGEVQSPTFTYLREYFIPALGKTICHYDMYRIEKISEYEDKQRFLQDISYFENLENKDKILFIEWSSNITEFLPKNYILVEIIVKSDGKREFIYTEK